MKPTDTLLFLCIFFIITCGAPTQSFAQNSGSDGSVNLGSRLELFVDSFLIESMQNCRLVMHKPVDEGPVIFFNKSWEGVFSGYTTIIKDTSLYRMYYRGIPSAGSDGSNAEVTCYAESADGINWTKPGLGLFEIKGSRNNNIILADAAPVTHNFSPFLDSNPSRTDKYRFKAFGGLNEGLIPYGSVDGIHWERIHDQPVVKGGQFDSQNVCFWSSHENLYVCYFRVWINSGGKQIRSVARSTSGDFMNWTSPVVMDFGATKPEELYTNQTSPYFRAPHIYVSIAARFFPGKQIITDSQAKRLNVNPSYYHDCSDAVLMTSRGGNSYQRTFMEGFLRPGIGLENWVSRTNYPALNVVPTSAKEMSFYVNQDYAQPGTHLHRYSLRIDGFTSLQAGYMPGEIITRPFTFSGKSLLINFSTSAAGHILFEITDEKNQVIEGYSFSDCIPLIGNEIERHVEWKRPGGSIDGLEGKQIRLRIRLRDADLFSIKFE